MGQRTVIVGGPKTGKTTLANSLPNVTHTDDLIDLGWDAAKEEIARQLGRDGSWTIEGVQAARGLRQWLNEHPEGKPCDTVVLVTEPKIPRTAGQARMGRAVATVFDSVVGRLKQRGVEVVSEAQYKGRGR